MRYLNDYSAEEAERLKARPWQIELLKANPDYCSWGPHEDYMWNSGTGWNSAQFADDWKSFATTWGLDDLNECVNFYFSVRRESVECTRCGGNGYHPDAQQTVRTFYSHSCWPGEVEWCDKITEDEAAMLVENGRGFKGNTTAAEFNAAQRGGNLMNSHDGINRMLLISRRLERLGIPQTCPDCEGHGAVFTEADAHASLTLWWLHPRKGCSRGIEIKRIEREDVPDIRNFLQYAAQRNADRFAGLAGLPIA